MVHLGQEQSYPGCSSKKLFLTKKRAASDLKGDGYMDGGFIRSLQDRDKILNRYLCDFCDICNIKVCFLFALFFRKVRFFLDVLNLYEIVWSCLEINY